MRSYHIHEVEGKGKRGGEPGPGGGIKADREGGGQRNQQ